MENFKILCSTLATTEWSFSTTACALWHTVQISFYFMDYSAVSLRMFCTFFQQFFQDGARIEAAFRRYFYRADTSQEKDSYEILVCHANVIRYFVCR